MNKDYLGQQGKKVQEVGWRKKQKTRCFQKNDMSSCHHVWKLFSLIDVKCQFLFFFFFWPWLTVMSRGGKTYNFKKNIFQIFEKERCEAKAPRSVCVGGIKIRGSEQSSCRRRFLPSPVSRNANIHHKRLEIQAQRQVNIARQKTRFCPSPCFSWCFVLNKHLPYYYWDDHLVNHLCFCMSTIWVGG